MATIQKRTFDRDRIIRVVRNNPGRTTTELREEFFSRIKSPTFFRQIRDMEDERLIRRDRQGRIFTK